MFAQGRDAEVDVLFQRRSKFFRAFAHVLVRDTFCKKFVFHAALHGIHFRSKILFDGRTYAQAVRKPASSSQAKRVCSSAVCRGTPQ